MNPLNPGKLFGCEDQHMLTDTLNLSVVVASHNARATIEESLSALLAQQQDGMKDIVVVDNSSDGTAELIRSHFPGIKLLIEPHSALIPQLWTVGIRETSGEVVAITTAHCVPERDWLSQIRKAHREPVPAIGGAIENDVSAGLVDWAVYFSRYSPYMLPFRQRFVTDIAGDNASYKREYLVRFQETWRDGFWEPAVHAELKGAGFRLLLVPSIVIRHKKSFSFLSFLKQRFQHGIKFGEERASHFSIPKRLLYLVLSPAIPLIFWVRITRQVMRRRRHLGKLLVAFPILVLFLLAWSFGEVRGYLRGLMTALMQVSSAVRSDQNGMKPERDNSR
jgi:glycosyltransferase involved in cell wall biosynthesis